MSITTIEALTEWKRILADVNYRTLNNKDFHDHFKQLASVLAEALRKGELSYAEFERATSY